MPATAQPAASPSVRPLSVDQTLPKVHPALPAVDQTLPAGPQAPPRVEPAAETAARPAAGSAARPAAGSSPALPHELGESLEGQKRVGETNTLGFGELSDERVERPGPYRLEAPVEETTSFRRFDERGTAVDWVFAPGDRALIGEVSEEA